MVKCPSGTAGQGERGGVQARLLGGMLVAQHWGKNSCNHFAHSISYFYLLVMDLGVTEL